LRCQLSDAVDECRNQLLFGSFTDMRGAESINYPMIAVVVRCQSANAGNRVIDVSFGVVR
jgi:hypothetical protein